MFLTDSADRLLSNHVSGQPFLPLGSGEAAANAAFFNTLDHVSVPFELPWAMFTYIEENSRRDMHSHNSIRLDKALADLSGAADGGPCLDHPFDVIGHLIASVQVAVIARLFWDLQQI